MDRDLQNVTDKLAKIEKDILYFKAAQLSGAGNTRSYETTSSGTWDLDITSTTIGTNYYSQFGSIEYTFISDKRAAGFVALEVDALIDGKSYYLSPKYGMDAIVHTSPFGGQSSGDKDVAKYRYTWEVLFGIDGSVPSPTHLQVKARVVGTDTGKIEKSIELLYG